MEFQRMQRELEHYKRISVAWKYTTALNHNEKTDNDIRLTKDTINEKLANIKIGEEEIREIDDKLAEIVKRRDAVSKQAAIR